MIGRGVSGLTGERRDKLDRLGEYTGRGLLRGNNVWIDR